ncbi:MAG: phosphoribosyltransferase family protein [Phycisphaerales bacterium]
MDNDRCEPSSGKQSGGAAQQRFAWPPRPPAGEADVAEAPASSERSAPALGHWEEFEHEWLGVVTPPLHRRLANAGTRPDPLNAFCWRCARTVGPYETDARGCSHCRGSRPPWSRFVRLGEYEAPWKRLVHDAKFTRWPRLAVDLGRLLGRQVAAAVPDLADRPTIVVPVPTNYFRRLWRGTDHSLNLARGVAAELNLPLRRMLSKANRPEQAKLSATDRETNLRDAMRRGWLDHALARVPCSKAAKWPLGSETARVILVDDISTTGATMREACRAARIAAKGLSIKDLEIVTAVVCRTEKA